MLSFAATPTERATIREIATRAHRIYRKHKVPGAPAHVNTMMDITAAHANGCPLRLQDLAAADDFNFMHDVNGIARHLDRETGQITDHFLPRFRVREEQA